MKVYIVGAIPERAWQTESNGWGISEPAYDNDAEFDNKKKEFGAACSAIGAALARAGHTIYVDIPSWERLQNGTTVVSYVIQGATQEKMKSKQCRIVLFHPKKIELADPNTPDVVDTFGELEALSVNASVDLTVRILDDDRDFFGVMREVDAFILLGGGPGTALTAQTAIYFNRPIVALQAFGGAAEDSFNLILSSIYKDMEIDAGEISVLARKWNADDEDKNKILADHIVRFTVKLHRIILYPRIPNQRTLMSFPSIVVLSMLLWAFILAALPQTGVLMFYITMLLLASIMGTALRLMVQSRSKTTITMTYSYIFREMAMGFVVSFGLMLLYVVGGITFAGQMIDVTETGTKPIAFALSVLGLAGGFVMPISRLRTQLNEATGGKKEDGEASSA